MTRKKKQLLCEENLRHNEYYGMQDTFDNLYAASKNGEVFTDLMSIVLQRENILLAYRNIKKNTGSKTCGTDKLTIRDIGKCSPDEVVEKVRFIVNGSEHGYRPKPVRRKEIPKPYDPSKTRPLGIPCIWDRLIQQCIKQVMEPVCEAKFSENSYGFMVIKSNSDHDERGLLPYPVIVAATKGDPDAMKIVLNRYEGDMVALSVRKMRDERGNTYYGVDQDIYDRLRARLIRVVLDFKV